MVNMALSDPPPPHMVTPPCVQLRPSAVTDGALGVWCVDAIETKKRFGPYAGEVVMEEDLDEKVDFRFAWEVINKETGKLMHVINATKPEVGNWMRYVNCARFFEEQNIVSVQEGAEVYYEALKDIKPGEELLTWFDPPISRRSRKRRRAGRSASTPDGEFTPPAVVNRLTTGDSEPSRNGKRRRKKKVDSDMLSLDDDDVIFAASGAHHNRIRTGASSGLRRSSSLPDGKMLPHRKSVAVETIKPRNILPPQQWKPVSEEQGQKTFTSSCQQTNTLFSEPTLNIPGEKQHIPQNKSVLKNAHPKKSISEIVASITAKREAEVKQEMIGSESNDSTSMSSTDASRSSSYKSRRSSIVGKAEDLEDLSSEFQFLFEITPAHKVIVRDGKKHVWYVCDACECKYHQAVNLKRHYLRTHVNHKYLSQDDINLCRNVVDASLAKVEADVDPDADEPEASASSSHGDVPSNVNIKTEPEETDKEPEKATPASVKPEEEQATQPPVKKSKKAERLAKEAQLKSKAEPGKVTFSYDGIDGVEDAFRCFLCVQLFPSIAKLKLHVEFDAHRSKGDKQFGCERCSQRFRFQHNYLRHIESHGTNFGALSTACHICGKKFLNEANMRKHLRFHSGRNFPCKYGCVDVVYPNVAELVKHLRSVHPNLPKRSELAHAGGSASLSGGDRKKRGRPKLHKKVESVAPEPSSAPDPEDPDAQEREAWLQSRPKGWVETRGRKPRPGVVGVHCTICKKKFSTYGSMCRHRRSVHRAAKQTSSGSVKSEQSPPPTPTEPEASNDMTHEEMVISHIEASIEMEYKMIEERMEQARLEEENMEFDFSPPPSPTTFYTSVADNIAENLSCYLDGGEAALQNAIKHIQVDDYVPLSERPDYQEVDNVEWTAYNFPPFFMPVDPVIPHPPAPPVQPDTKLSILADGERTAAYPTRAVVASESRRASVGQDVAESNATKTEPKPLIAREDSMASSVSSESHPVADSEAVTFPSSSEPTTAAGHEAQSSKDTSERDDDTQSRDSVFAAQGETVDDQCKSVSESKSLSVSRRSESPAFTGDMIQQATETENKILEGDLEKGRLSVPSETSDVCSPASPKEGSGSATEIVHLTQPPSLIVLATSTAKAFTSPDKSPNIPTSQQADLKPCQCENDDDPNCARRFSGKEDLSIAALSDTADDMDQDTSEPASGGSLQTSSVPKPAVSESEREGGDSMNLPLCSDEQSLDHGQVMQDSQTQNIVQDIIEEILLDICEKSCSDLPTSTVTSAVSSEGTLVMTGDHSGSQDSENAQSVCAENNAPKVVSGNVLDSPETSQESSTICAITTEESKQVCANDPGQTLVESHLSVSDTLSASEQKDETEKQATPADISDVINLEKSVPQHNSAVNNGVENTVVSNSASISVEDEKMAVSEDHEAEAVGPTCAGDDVEVTDVSSTVPGQPHVEDKNTDIDTDHKEDLKSDPDKKAVDLDVKDETVPLLTSVGPHSACPSLLGKPSDHSSHTSLVAEAKQTDLNPISLKEVEYLCKGLTHYIRRDCVHCQHLEAWTSKTDIRAISEEGMISSAMEQDRLIGALDLAGKKDTETVYKVLKRCNSDLQQKMIDSEADLKTAEKEACDEAKTCGTSAGPSQEKTNASKLLDGQKYQPASIFLQDQSSQSSVGSSRIKPDDPNPDYSDSDSELLDLMMELELRKRQERQAIDQDAEQACEDCLRKRQHSVLLEAPAKWSAADFEKIRFGKYGKNGLVYSVCSMCHRYYGGVDFLIRHQWKKHPSIQCSHMDVELGHNLETLFYLQPSTHGILAQSVLLPPEHLTLDTYTCTRCKTSFKQYNRLRAHILNCDPNAPTPSHVRKKKLKQRNRHRFMEKMYSGPSSAPSELKQAGKDAMSPRKDFSTSAKQFLQSPGRKTHTQVSPGKHQLTTASSRVSVRTPSTNSSRSSTPTKAKSGHGREITSPSKLSAYSPSSQGSLSPTTGRGRKRRNYELLYNPAAHVRRRETAECLEVHQCRGCGLRCKTLSLLERHARKCSGKEKLQNQRPVMNKLLEAASSKKHPCHYCPKRFTYLKGVANHYRNNFCRMRLERIARGGLTAEDLKHEADLQESILRQAWNKTENRDHTDVIQGRAHLHDDGTITPTRRRGGWPKGVKRGNKRRRHGWTYIKRRKTEGNSSTESKDGADGSVAGSGDGDQSDRSTPSTAASTPATSPATNTVMSELEARLREPVVKRGGKKVSTTSKHKPQELRESFPGSQIARHAHPAKKYQKTESDEQNTSKIEKTGKFSMPKRHDKDKCDAPVIDRMSSEGPPGDQPSPDPEPPTLSPVTPFAPGMDLAQTTENTDDAGSRRSRRKRRSRASEGDEDESQDMKGSRAHSQSKSGKLDSKADSQSAATAGSEQKSLLLHRPTTQMGKGGMMQRFKLFQLKIPNLVPKSSGTASSHESSKPEKDLESSTSTFPVSKDPPKPLPPNFLFPPPDQDKTEAKEGKKTEAAHPELLSFLEGKPGGASRPKSDKKSKGSGGKNATGPLTVNTSMPTTINSIFKTRKSPQSVTNTSTLKKMGAYRLEKTAGAPVTTTTVTSSQGKTAATFTPLIPVSSMPVLPPGAMVAVLPTSPILLQTVPSTMSKTTAASTPPAKVSLATSNALQTAVAEGKVLIALDTRNLMCLPSGSIPVAGLNQQPLTSTLKTSPVSVSSKGKTASQHLVKNKPLTSDRKTATTTKTSAGKTDSEITNMQKPKIDVPNFLFDSKQDDTQAESSEISSAKKEALTDVVSPQDTSITQAADHEKQAAAAIKSSKSTKKKPKRGPPPHSQSPGSKIKSMVMMTAPGVHTMLSLDVPTSPSRGDPSPTLTRNKKALQADQPSKESGPSQELETEDDNAVVSLDDPEEKTSGCGSVSDDDMPLSEVAAKMK